MPDITTYSDTELLKMAGQSSDIASIPDEELMRLSAQDDLSGVSDEELIRMSGQSPSVPQEAVQPPITPDMGQYAEAYAQPESVMLAPGEDVTAGIVPRGTSEIAKAWERGKKGAGAAIGRGLEYIGEEFKQREVPPLQRTIGGKEFEIPMGSPISGEAVIKAGAGITEHYEDILAKHPEWMPSPEFMDRPWYDPERLAATMAETLPLTGVAMGSGVVAGIITKNPYVAATVSGTIFGATSAGDILKEAKKEGLSIEEALPAARLAFGGEVVLEFIPGYMFMRMVGLGRPLKKKLIKEGVKEVNRAIRVAYGMGKLSVAEGLEEGLQTTKDNLIARGYWEPDRPIFQDVPESTTVGTIMGWGLGGVGTAIGTAPQTINKIREDIQALPETQLPSEQRDAIIAELGRQEEELAAGLREAESKYQPPVEEVTPQVPEKVEEVAITEAVKIEDISDQELAEVAGVELEEVSPKTKSDVWAEYQESREAVTAAFTNWSESKGKTKKQASIKLDEARKRDSLANSALSKENRSIIKSFIQELKGNNIPVTKAVGGSIYIGEKEEGKIRIADHALPSSRYDIGEGTKFDFNYLGMSPLEVKKKIDAIRKKITSLKAKSPQEIAKQYNLDYNGEQEFPGKEPLHLFTLKDKGAESTFPVESLEPKAIEAKIKEVRERFGVKEKVDVKKDDTAYLAGDKHISFRKGEDIPEPSPEVQARKKPIRREDVLQPLVKALGISLYQGRIKGTPLGFFKRGKEEVRIKKKSDMEVTAHEVAHLLDSRIPEIQKSWRSGLNATAHRKELKSISYDKAKIKEGFAEFVRLWMTQKDQAVKVAPQYSEWFEGFIEKSEYGKVLKKAQKNMHAWFEQGALGRAKSKIGTQKEINDIEDSLFDRFRQSVADDLHGVYKMERELTGGIAPVGPYETARLTRAGHAIMDGAIRAGYPVVNEDGSHSFKGKGLEEILEPVSGSLDDWLLYAVGRSANELMAQGRENLFTPTEIEAMTKLETKEFRKAFDDYQVWNTKIVDFAEAKGLINPESRKLWKRTQYLPFYREGQTGQTKRVKGIEGNWSGVKMLTGGTGNVRDILRNIKDNASHMIIESLKNEARVSIADMADSLPKGAKFMTQISKDTQSVSVGKEEIERFVYKELFGLNKSDIKDGNIPEAMISTIDQMVEHFTSQPEYMKFWVFGQAPKGNNIIAVLRKGKPTFYEVADPILFRAISSLNRPVSKSVLMNILRSVKRTGQATITLTLDFMTANIARDTVMGGIMSRSGFIPIKDSISGMKSRVTEDKAYWDFIANGGGLSSHLLDERALKKHLEKFYVKKGLNPKYILDTPNKVAYFLKTLSDAFEMSTRVGEYKQAIKKGAQPRHAAYQSREVSTDFAMRGDSALMNFFYDSVMFLKAGVNGIDRLYRGVSHDPNRGAIGVKVGMLAAISTVLYLINKDIEEYNDLPDWEKDTYWHFFIPKKGGGYHHFRYPKIWEIGAVASIAERAAANVIKGSPKEFADDFQRIALSQFKLEFIPQAIRPLYEQAKNRIGFIDVPIESQSMKNLQPWSRAKPRGSRALRSIGEATRKFPRKLQVPPARAEALLRGYFNTWAMYGLSLTDSIFYDNMPAKRLDQTMGIRRFYKQSPPRRTKYETMFYDMLRETTELRQTMRHMDEYKTDFADEIESQYGDVLQDYNQLKNLNREMRGIGNEINLIYEDKKTPPKEKRRQLDNLIIEKNTLLKEVITEIEKDRETRGE